MPHETDTTAPPDEVPAIPAATVVVLRDGAAGLEVLMVRRNAKLAFAGGHWVFPGGRVDPTDDPVVVAPGSARRPPADEDEARARAAAVRETQEEAGLDLEAADLVWFAHWTPPSISPKRFATWFFVVGAPAGEVVIDGGEIHDHAWRVPSEALAARDAGEIELSPPTWITLDTLAAYPDVATALDGLAASEPIFYATRIAGVEGGLVALYDGDAGYDDEDPVREGPRHRLWMVEPAWWYERDPAPGAS